MGKELAIPTKMPGLNFWLHLIWYGKGHIFFFFFLFCSVNDGETGLQLIPYLLMAGQKTHLFSSNSCFFVSDRVCGSLQCSMCINFSTLSAPVSSLVGANIKFGRRYFCWFKFQLCCSTHLQKNLSMSTKVLNFYVHFPNLLRSQGGERYN